MGENEVEHLYLSVALSRESKEVKRTQIVY